MMQLPKTLSRNGWTPQHLLMTALMVMLGIVATLDVWLDICKLMFAQEEFRHMLLVPPVALWLAWVRRARVRLCCPTGQLLGVLMIALGWTISSWGYYNGIEAFWHGGALLIVLGCFTCVVGVEIVIYFLPSFIALLFLIPAPGVIRTWLSVPMQGLVARGTQFVFEVVGVEVMRTGSLLSVNGMDVTISEACNGMQLVFALLLVSFCFAFSFPLRHYVRLLILLASPVSTLVCNIIRTVCAVWVYGHYEYASGAFHAVSGWVMLLVSFGLLLCMIRLLRWALVPVTRFTLVYD
ncbi:exosortase/archaeosortase family protein [bacterium AH-315-I18]|nr:exosortase/archaeosortase family protein [Phycisphaeraceae bacterium]MBN4061118.1 exosortase/archaeosortase family protein [bacterium AH-315-I18]